MGERIEGAIELVKEAKSWVGQVHEIGTTNRGPEIDRFTALVFGRAVGHPWCACFVSFCVREVKRKGGFGTYFRSRGGVRDMISKNAALKVDKVESGIII